MLLGSRDRDPGGMCSREVEIEIQEVCAPGGQNRDPGGMAPGRSR